jgi:hypothetical protein
MRVNDLDHFSNLTNSVEICGGLMADNILFLDIIDRKLLLSFGGKPLFETTLSDVPSGIQISLENVPGIPINVRAVSIGGGTRTISVFAGQSMYGSGTTSATATSSVLAL